MDIEKNIRNFALLNAIQHDGIANPGSVIGQLMQTNPEIKKDMKNISKQINEIIKKVNKLSLKEQEKELKSNAPELLAEKPKEKREGLKELKNAKKGKVVMRFEPSPSGPLHIGHAYVGSLNAEYCRMYEGKLIIRISDTNANNIYEPAYEQISQNSEWLWGRHVKEFEVVIQSDRLDIYYDYAEELFQKGALYICDCDPEEFKKLITNKTACPCRSLAKEEHLKRWKKMLDPKGYKEGQVVVRFKSSVEDKNPAMRDFPLLRINETEHPKQGKKYRVWPLMNFAVAIDDLTMGITHSIRGKDHYDNEKRQRMIFRALGKEDKAPEALFVGRINFEGFEVSCTKTKEKIEKKEFTGWDDIRLPFIPALKRRGYLSEAFMKYAVDVGVSMNDKTVHISEFFQTLNSFNRDFIDSIAKRLFFIEDPVKIKIGNAPKQNLELDLHPENKKKGRKFKTDDEFYIAKNDLELIKELKEGELIRLMDCLNFVRKNDKFIFDSKDYKKYKGNGKMIIHWLPVDEEQLVDVNVLMPDNNTAKGKGEKVIATELIVNEVCQFERVGFARLDSLNVSKNSYTFWFAHN